MASKVATTKISSGAEYAKVPDRLKQFREDNPRSSVVTEPTITGEMIIFKATIIVDKADKHSKDATGHSYGQLSKDKGFEKQETIAVGRALALLGYLNDGQIASTEEMEEFEEFRLGKHKETIDSAESVKELLDLFSTMSSQEQAEFTPLLSEKKAELEAANEAA